MTPNISWERKVYPIIAISNNAYESGLKYQPRPDKNIGQIRLVLFFFSFQLDQELPT